ncbi:Phosphoglycerate mutase [Halothece sp. PCC 7418]|uniref:histidine phosphatase family protein n=1 Tax=Halothece sp. (strain PCC 7418) TaxID=65093 RepID=UPI0002A06625|nr:histidine phosphatase family protein [Halothece sp. PCC 7418]AFZ44687.1 Phosphoglycerate mutase [Halothece sp. PCC 7418]
MRDFLPNFPLSPLPKTGTRILLLRHGRSTLNDQQRYQGSSDDSTLTDQGHLASQQMGQFLENCPLDAVYVSPLQRAQETLVDLLPYLKTQPQQIQTSELLQEIKFPTWEGRSYQEVRTQDSDRYQCWQMRPDQFQIQTEENCVFYPVLELYERIQQFWQTILPLHSGETLLIVGHGSSNQALINTAFGISPRYHHYFQQTHSGLTVFDILTPGCSQMQLLNFTLDSGLPKLKVGKQGLRLVLLPFHPHCPPQPMLLAKFNSVSIQEMIGENCDLLQQLAQAHLEAKITILQESHLSLRALSPLNHKELNTVCAIALPSKLSRLLSQLFPFPHSVELFPNTFSVVHYPSSQNFPILQGMNLNVLKG